MQIENLLEQLFQHQSLSQPQAEQLFRAIFQGELSNEQLAAALIAFKMRGETPEEISGAVNVLLQNAEPFPSPDYPFADIVGTGGDGANTINISTASAIIGTACGLKIAKHGNRSVSSQTGSSDLLTTLGVNITMSAEQARKALDEIGLCFLFAQQYHLSFRHVAPVRQALKTRTIFNILGPLVNPAKPTRQLLGVSSPHLLQPYAETVVRLNHQHTIVVHGSRLDEVALHGTTDVVEVRDGKIERYTLSPADFGLETQPLAELVGGNPAQNAEYLTALLQGKGKKAHNHAVAINVAMLLKLFGNDDLKQNTERALEVIASGKGFSVLTRLTQY